MGNRFVTKQKKHELSTPKDIISGLLKNAKKSKEEFIHAVKDEIHKYLSKVDIMNLVSEVADKYDIQVNATIKLKPKKKSKVKK